MKKFLFTIDNIFTYNSGTELSVINRLKLFANYQLKAQIVTRSFNPSLHQEMEKFNLTTPQVINMYNYFQNALNIPRKPQYLRYASLVDKREYKIHGIDNNSAYIEKLGQRFAKVSYFPLTFGEIGNVDYYDNFGNITSRDMYDYRGFKSKTIYYHPDGNIGHEILYSTTGIPVMHITHMNIGTQLATTMYKLVNYHGKDYRFNTENDLFAFFLQQITDKHTVLINDQPALTPAVAQVTKTTYKYQYLHSVHTAESELPTISAPIAFNLEPLFNHHLDDFAGIIVATKEQKADLQKRFANLNVICIVDFALFHIPDITPAVNNHKITYCGRIFNDKNIIELLTIIPAIRFTVPDIHLNLVGYFESAKFKAQIEAIIKRLDIEKNVSILNYQTEKPKAEILKNSRLLVQPSLHEALGISLVEGLNYGLPAVAFDGNYGSRNVIVDDENGCLVTPGTPADMANRIAKIVSDDTVYTRYHKQALRHAHNFAAKQVIQQWQDFIKAL